MTALVACKPAPSPCERAWGRWQGESVERAPAEVEALLRQAMAAERWTLGPATLERAGHSVERVRVLDQADGRCVLELTRGAQGAEVTRVLVLAVGEDERLRAVPRARGPQAVVVLRRQP
jgi:hypothetical protein